MTPAHCSSTTILFTHTSTTITIHTDPELQLERGEGLFRVGFCGLFAVPRRDINDAEAAGENADWAEVLLKHFHRLLNVTVIGDVRAGIQVCVSTAEASCLCVMPTSAPA